MRIEEDIKLDYSDVLFRPKRSTLHSRKDVELKRTYKFKHSNNEWSGIPIMAANMDGVGELEVAKSLAKFELMTCLTKQHDIKIIKRCSYIKSIYPHLAFSTGTRSEDFKKLNENKITIIITSHVMDDAMKCDKVIFFIEGKIVAYDTPVNLIKYTKTNNLGDAFVQIVNIGYKK